MHPKGSCRVDGPLVDKARQCSASFSDIVMLGRSRDETAIQMWIVAQ